jgi:hypothetical protein
MSFLGVEYSEFTENVKSQNISRNQSLHWTYVAESFVAFLQKYEMNKDNALREYLKVYNFLGEDVTDEVRGKRKKRLHISFYIYFT